MDDKGEPETLLEKAKRCFKQAVEAEAKQREREKDDLQFQVPENQWTAAARAERMGDVSRAMPPRPMLSISKLDQPIQLILNQARQAQLGVNIHPVSEDADDDTAEVLQGLYRRIERDSNAPNARLWALDRATKCGKGAYRINTKWDEDSPDTFDQEIVIERILHQDAVYFDPSAQKPDFSDGEWAFVTSWVPIETFRRLYPGAQFSQAEDREFGEIASSEPGWVKGDGDSRAVLVAEYFYKVHDRQVIKNNGRSREMDQVTVKWCKLTAHEVLEQEDWNGKYIPIVPVVGRELQPFDSERRWVGLIGHAKDAQRFYNYSVSTLVERMALEPKTPWVMTEGQAEGYEDMWKQSNVRNFPALFYRPQSLGDKQVPPPQRAQLDQTGMSIAMQGIQAADDWIQGTTSIYDPSLGRTSPREKSGRAILALQDQSNAGTSHFLASLADTSMPLEARIILDLIPKIYDRPGRVTKILGGEDESRAVMLNAPFVMDQSGERPQPAQPGQPGVKEYNLDGVYTISVNIGKSFQTRLQEGGTMIGEILSSRPELMPLIGPTFFQFQDFPGSKEIAEVLKKVRNKQMPFLAGEEDEAPTPEQLQAELQAMRAQNQEMQQQLQMAIKQIETDQAKQQAKIAEAELDAKTKLELAKLEQQDSAREDQLKLMLERMEQQFEQVQKALDRAHEEQMHREEMAHEVAMKAAEGVTFKYKREGGQETGSEEGRETGQESMPADLGGEA